MKVLELGQGSPYVNRIGIGLYYFGELATSLGKGKSAW